jgi:hypothetical protein
MLGALDAMNAERKERNLIRKIMFYMQASAFIEATLLCFIFGDTNLFENMETHTRESGTQTLQICS